jgi:hypothetical protein
VHEVLWTYLDLANNRERMRIFFGQNCVGKLSEHIVVLDVVVNYWSVVDSSFSSRRNRILFKFFDEIALLDSFVYFFFVTWELFFVVAVVLGIERDSRCEIRLDLDFLDVHDV